MKRRIIPVLLSVILILSMLTGCQNNTNENIDVEDYDRYTRTFFGSFDTVISVIMYDTDEDHANEGLDYLESRMGELHDMYTRYNKVEGLNNLWAVNRYGHDEPVPVPDELYNLISDSIDWYNDYSDRTDISIGTLVDVWNYYQDLNNDEESTSLKDIDRLPTEQELAEAAESIDIDNIVLDPEEKSVYISNPDTVIDLGATGKGYAVDLVVDEMVDMGYENLIVSGGGDVKAVGRPMEEGRTKWGIGVQNPDILDDDSSGNNVLDTLYVNDMSVVTSGDYQRFFEVDGERYHHIIDKDTKMPVNYYRSITVSHPDGGIADFLATAIYVLEFDTGKDLIDSIDGAEALWVFSDGRVEYTEGMASISKSHGASGRVD